MRKPKLKPCPFCGGEAEIFRYQADEDGLDVTFHGRCTGYKNGKAMKCSRIYVFRSHRAAVRAWNRRWNDKQRW